MPYKILVVEDDPTIQRELVTLLQAEGYEAAAVVDFSTTLSQVNTVQPHLILLDIKLPGQSGFSLCSQIRAFSTVPIIFVTSCNTDMDELSSILLGGDAFITKPYHTAILLAKIAALLRRAYPDQPGQVLTYGGAELHLETQPASLSGAGGGPDQKRAENPLLSVQTRRDHLRPGGSGLLSLGQPALCGRQRAERQHRPNPGKAFYPGLRKFHQNQTPAGIHLMSARLFWKQQFPLLLVHLLSMAALACFLALNGNNRDSILLILLTWAGVAGGWMVRSYLLRKHQLDALLSLSESLRETYLIGEIMQAPTRADDQVYYQILKRAGRSMLEQISAIQRERGEYREYIEQWIHEVKTPIAASKLLCENHPSPASPALLSALEAIDRYTEQALYYARSEHTEKDYFIRELRLFDAVHQSIGQNKYLLLQNGVTLQVHETEDTIFSDEKWLCFILNQLISNAVKYRRDPPVLTFRAVRNQDTLTLSLQDNGIGIDARDLPRIFDKGFTGQNGRRSAPNATGLGLYLCKRLCDKLDIGLQAQSSPAGTTLSLTFRINDFIHGVQGPL